MATPSSTTSENSSVKNSKNDVNILLLGEAGVGKSTFINAFANYLTYEDLPGNPNQTLVSLIPTTFTMYDHKDEEITVRFGEETTHEKCVVGEAGTRYPSCYEFSLGERKVRIIDTPGIGDPRGIDQDNINFENILSYISHFEHLHCICILLKPNHARLSVTFDFCIKQLLCHLQKDASKNIVFMYTNCRSTFYKPGETGPLLKKMLKSIAEHPPHVQITYDTNTYYCMDNEAFRFILAIHQGVEFDDDTKKDFQSSWSKSAKECQRLLKYIVGFPAENIVPLQPHRIKDTISVNTARKMILGLSRPLAEIINNISLNITVLENHKNKITQYSQNINALNEQLYIPVIRLKVVPIDNPRTACTAADCSELQAIEGIQRYVHKKICHEPCTIKNIPGDIIGHAELQFCEAISPETGNCLECGCSYLVHIHQYYDIEEVNERIVDKTVEAQISKEISNSEKVEIILKVNQKRIDVYENEKKMIARTMATFAHFLKENAIICYNDAFKRYLKYKIENLKGLSKHGEDNLEMIKGLEQMIKDYEQKIEQLEDAFKKANGNGQATDADEIIRTIEELKKLEFSGAKIVEMVEAQEKMKKQEFQHRKIVVQNNSSGGILKLFNRAYNTGTRLLTSLVPKDTVGNYYNAY